MDVVADAAQNSLALKQTEADNDSALPPGEYYPSRKYLTGNWFDSLFLGLGYPYSQSMAHALTLPADFSQEYQGSKRSLRRTLLD